MATTVEAVYEAGALRLLEPLSLEEGARVKVIVIGMPAALPIVQDARPGGDRRTPAQILAQIAALSIEGEGEEFSGRDHDRILYGERGAR